MLREVTVEVRIRKGLGPEWITKNYPCGYDDLPEETTDYEIKQMARQEVEQHLRSTIDYPEYGENWEIVDYHFT